MRSGWILLLACAACGGDPFQVGIPGDPLEASATTTATPAATIGDRDAMPSNQAAATADPPPASSASSAPASPPADAAPDPPDTSSHIEASADVLTAASHLDAATSPVDAAPDTSMPPPDDAAPDAPVMCNQSVCAQRCLLAGMITCCVAEALCGCIAGTAGAVCH